MEPLKPIYRDALKEANPGLTDEIIDRSEDLLAQRFLVDPETEPLRIRQLDREREVLRREMIPNFEQVIEKTQGQAGGDQ
jgi:hypothetical protein